MRTAKNLVAGTVLAAMAALAPVQVNAQSLDEIATMQAFLGIMNDYFGIIESTGNTTAKAVCAVSGLGWTNA